MSLTLSLLKPPLPSSKPQPPTTTFLHGATNFSLLHSFSSLSLSTSPPSSTKANTTFPVIKAMRSMTGKVVCATNDKTVNVEVVRLAPHPKYKRRVRKKKKYQAHDPDNQFKVGDWVQLEKCRPISKTKAFLAVVAPGRTRKAENGDPPSQFDLPLQSSQQEDKV